MRKHLFRSLIAAGVVCLLSACSREETEFPSADGCTAQAIIHIGMNTATRAAQALDTGKYPTRMYLFAQNGEKTDYGYVREADITSQEAEDGIILTGLEAGKEYKAVFLAKPKEEADVVPLPSFSSTKQSYKQAAADYLSENRETGFDLFRAIVTFTATAEGGTHPAVLTRQNGALEIRLKRMKDVKSVKLEVLGHKAMYLHDGTGGQVSSPEKTPGVLLSKASEGAVSATDYRIRIHLLPQEDITNNGEKNTGNKLTITYTDGRTEEHRIASDQPLIPIYPNQVTWLTLTGDGGGEGNFELGFGGGLGLDDDRWDGWEEMTESF